MFPTICPDESAVLATEAAGGDMAPPLRAHLDKCASCREALALTRSLAPLATTAGEEHALPDPTVIWWKAQLLRRWEADRKVAAPLERMQRVEVVVGFASLVVFLVWQWSGIARLFALLSPAALVSSASAASAAVSSPNATVVLVAAFAIAVGVMAGIHRALVRG